MQKSSVEQRQTVALDFHREYCLSSTPLDCRFMPKYKVDWFDMINDRH
jgi:hypothetical protein